MEKEMATHSSVLSWRIPGMGGAWWAAVSGVAQGWTWLGSDLATAAAALGKNAGVGCHSLLQLIYYVNLLWDFGNLVLFLTHQAVCSVQSLSHVRLFATPWTAARQASLSISNSQSSLKLVPIKSVMPSNHLILCHPLLLLPSVFPSIRVFSKQSVRYVRWPKYRSFSFSISPSSEHSGLISFRVDWFDLLAVQGTLRSFLQHQTTPTPGHLVTLITAIVGYSIESFWKYQEFVCYLHIPPKHWNHPVKECKRSQQKSHKDTGCQAHSQTNQANRTHSSQANES